MTLKNNNCILFASVLLPILAAILLGVEVDRLGAALTTTETTIPGQTGEINFSDMLRNSKFSKEGHVRTAS